MRYIIYGAGAIGGTLGARLFQAGNEVLLVARGEHLAQIQAVGLRYTNPEGSQLLAVPAVGHPREITFRVDDVVILTVKSQHTEAALLDLEAAAPISTPVICCQNGVANESMAARRFHHVYAMVVMLPASHLAPGEVLHQATGIGGFLDAGRFPTGTDSMIRQVCADLTAAGFSAIADTRPLRWKYAKLLQNLGNALQAICDAGPAGADIMGLARGEALACYAAAGIECATREETRARFGSGMVIGAVAGAERSGSSSWQSLQRGTGDIESDYLNGEICLLGRLHGIPTPANDTLRHLANRVARERLSPGHYSIDEVASAIAAQSVSQADSQD